MDAINKDLKQLWHQTKTSAKKRDIEFNLTMVDLHEMSFPITCPCIGVQLKFNTGYPKDDSYSLDRIDSTKGYVFDNIVVVSYRANKLKSNATLQEMENIVKYYKEVS